jgi:hypothetical protein
MSDLAFVLVALGLAIILAAISLTAAFRVAKLLRRHRRRQQPLTDEQVADALGTFGVDISVWPSRAPRNGSTHYEDIA